MVNLRFFLGKTEKARNGRTGRGRHLSVLNLKFDFISDGGCTREEQIALSLKRHLFPHGGREPKAFWICFSRVHPPSEIKSNFKFKTLKRHLLKRHLTLSDNYFWSFLAGGITWKSRYWYRYRPEGIFRKFSALILHLPRYICSTAKNRQIHWYRPFFPIAWPF